MSITLEPVRVRFPLSPGFGLRNLARLLASRMVRGDIAVVSSKVVSYCEGSVADLSEITPSREAVELGKKYGVDERLAELVLREADEILGGCCGFLLTLKHGVLCPNAGIDFSNAPGGFAVLYPRDPEKSARVLHEEIARKAGEIGIVISDSRILPLRRGVSGIAIAACGFEAVVDERGRRDIFGRELKSTFRNIADMLSSASQLLMGEGDELVPAVVVRGLKVKFRDGCCDLSIPAEECIYRELFRF